MILHIHFVLGDSDVEAIMGVTSCKTAKVAVSHLLHWLSFPGVVYLNITFHLLYDIIWDTPAMICVCSCRCLFT